VGSSWFLFRLAAAVIIEPNETIEQNDESVARFEMSTAVLLKIKPCRMYAASIGKCKVSDISKDSNAVSGQTSQGLRNIGNCSPVVTASHPRRIHGTTSDASVKCESDTA